MALRGPAVLAGPGETAGGLTRWLAARLRAAFAAAGRDGTPELDARLLVAHALQRDPSRLALFADEPAGTATVAAAEALVARRIAGEPVARILGTKGFWTLTLSLSPETLVPRPDTETVVEAALATLTREGRRGEALRLLDLGTGSGAILLALLSELPEATGVGVDVSEGAARTAQANAERLGLSERAAFVVGNWARGLSGRFDLVAANPPYIVRDEIPGLPVEVSGYDPHIALDGGADGFDAHRAILADLERLLAPGGHAFIEVGVGQAPHLAELATGLGFDAARFRDLAGTERVVGLSVRGKPGPD